MVLFGVNMGNEQIALGNMLAIMDWCRIYTLINHFSNAYSGMNLFEIKLYPKE